MIAFAQPDIDLMSWQSHMLVLSETPRIQIHAIESGPPNAEKTIIFIHGFGGWASQWQAQLDCFSKSARVIALDLRGHGQSDKPHSDYSASELIGDLEHVVQALDVKRPLMLVGHSFGSALVAEYAVKHPNQVEKLALLNASSNYSVSKWMTLPLYIPNWLFDWLLGVINSIVQVFAAPSYVLKNLYWNGIDRWAEADIFPKVTQPTLVLSPKWDPVFSQDQMSEVAKILPDAEEIKIETWGHMTMMRRPTEVNQALARFLGLPKC